MPFPQRTMRMPSFKACICPTACETCSRQMWNLMSCSWASWLNSTCIPGDHVHRQISQASWSSPDRATASEDWGEFIPIVSIVVPFWGLPFRILSTKLVTPKKRNYNGDYRYLRGHGIYSTPPAPLALPRSPEALLPHQGPLRRQRSLTKQICPKP